jgi:hypothetical protein
MEMGTQMPATSSNKVGSYKIMGKTFGGTFVIAVLMGLILQTTMSYSVAAQTSTQSECEGDTVDRMGPRIAEEARGFLAELAAAVRAGNRSAVSRMIQYPLKISIGGKQTHVENSSQFVHNYSSIVTKDVTQIILSEKSSRCLFANSQGFMIGDGEVWFKKISDHRFKIITINVD